MSDPEPPSGPSMRGPSAPSPPCPRVRGAEPGAGPGAPGGRAAPPPAAPAISTEPPPHLSRSPRPPCKVSPRRWAPGSPPAAVALRGRPSASPAGPGRVQAASPSHGAPSPPAEEPQPTPGLAGSRAHVRPRDERGVSCEPPFPAPRGERGPGRGRPGGPNPHPERRPRGPRAAHPGRTGALGPAPKVHSVASRRPAPSRPIRVCSVPNLCTRVFSAPFSVSLGVSGSLCRSLPPDLTPCGPSLSSRRSLFLPSLCVLFQSIGFFLPGLPVLFPQVSVFPFSRSLCSLSPGFHVPSPRVSLFLLPGSPCSLSPGLCASMSL